MSSYDEIKPVSLQIFVTVPSDSLICPKTLLSIKSVLTMPVMAQGETLYKLDKKSARSVSMFVRHTLCLLSWRGLHC